LNRLNNVVLVISLGCQCSSAFYTHITTVLCIAAVETATAALKLVNGYDFKGKPIIIAYGNRTQAAGDVAASRTDAEPDITGSCRKASEDDC